MRRALMSSILSATASIVRAASESGSVTMIGRPRRCPRAAPKRAAGHLDFPPGAKKEPPRCGSDKRASRFTNSFSRNSSSPRPSREVLARSYELRTRSSAAASRTASTKPTPNREESCWRRVGGGVTGGGDPSTARSSPSTAEARKALEVNVDLAEQARHGRGRGLGGARCRGLRRLGGASHTGG